MTVLLFNNLGLTVLFYNGFNCQKRAPEMGLKSVFFRLFFAVLRYPKFYENPLGAKPLQLRFKFLFFQGMGNFSDSDSTILFNLCQIRDEQRIVYLGNHYCK